MAVVELELGLTLRAFLFPPFINVKAFKIHWPFAFMTTDDKIGGIALFIGAFSGRPQSFFSVMKVGRGAEGTATVFKTFVTKLTLIELAVVKGVMLGGPAALWTRHVLFGNFAMSALEPVS